MKPALLFSLFLNLLKNFKTDWNSAGRVTINSRTAKRNKQVFHIIETIPPKAKVSDKKKGISFYKQYKPFPSPRSTLTK